MAATYGNLPFNEAIDFIKNKINLPTKTYADITNEMHGRAFVVAGANKIEMVADFHEAILKAISTGSDIGQFGKDFDAIVQKYGWSYNGKRGWRTSIMLDTNLSTAYSAGRELQRRTPAVVKTFPNTQYRTMDDGRVRPLHQSWNGTTLPWDDPWWDTHTPPNGYNCRCWTEPVAGSPDDSAPNDGEYAWKNPATGKTEYLPAGIDPGFAYNPADAAWGRGINKTQIDKASVDVFKEINPLSYKDYKQPAQIPADTVMAKAFAEKAANETQLRNYLRTAIGGEQAVYTSPVNDSVYISQAICDHIMKDPKTRLNGRERYFPFIKYLVEDPFEIWIAFGTDDTGKVSARQRYIKKIQLDKKTTVNLVSHVKDNMWTGFTFFTGDSAGMRKGRLLYARK